MEAVRPDRAGMLVPDGRGERQAVTYGKSRHDGRQAVVGHTHMVRREHGGRMQRTWVCLCMVVNRSLALKQWHVEIKGYLCTSSPTNKYSGSAPQQHEGRMGREQEKLDGRVWPPEKAGEQGMWEPTYGRHRNED